MNEKELLAKISLLKNIKPRQDWVILTRNRIFGVETPVIGWTGLAARQIGQVGQMLIFLRKPAFAMAAFIFIAFGGIFVQIVRQSLPGDTFYALRARVESTQFTSIELAQKRLADIKEISAQNNVAKLPSAIKEFQSSSAQVSKDFIALVENQPKKALQASREIVQLQKDKAQLEKTLGAKFDTQENSDLENATKTLLKNEFSDLDSRTLTQSQLVLLNEAKNAFVKGDYQTALEKVWTITN